jgi:hypothetical protein
VAGIGFQLAAQMSDVHIEGTRAVPIFDVPDLLEQLVTRNGATSLLHEQGQDLATDGPQFVEVPIELEPAGIRVQTHASRTDPVRRMFNQCRFDQFHELIETIGSGQMGVYLLGDGLTGPGQS